MKARVIDNWVPVKRENASQYIIYGNSGKTRFKDISIAEIFTEENRLFTNEQSDYTWNSYLHLIS